MNVTSAQLSQEVKDIIWKFANKRRANISDANLHLAIALSLYKWKLEGVKYESLISNQFIYEVMGECLDITDYLTQDDIDLLLENYLEVIDFCLHFNKVDYSFKIFFLADRQLNRHCISFESLLNHVHDPVEVSTHDIHFINENHSWYMILLCLSPDCF